MGWELKGEIEVFAPSLLSVLFPGNAILHKVRKVNRKHGGKQKVCSSGSGGSHHMSSLSSSLVLQRKLVCYCMCNNTVMRYNKLQICFFYFYFYNNGIKLG